MISSKTFAAALILAAGLSSGAFAQSQTEPVQKPARCTSEQSGFRAQNGVNTYYVEVTSACARRQRCTINAYVVGSRGGKTGQGTITLGKASPGQETKKTWSMRTTENGGTANMSWSCKDI